jgi:hypothetical protein
MITIPFLIYDDGGYNQTPQAIAIVVDGKVQRMKLLLKVPSIYRKAVFEDMKKAFSQRYPLIK